MDRNARHLETLAIHAGREDLRGLGVHALPIDLSTTNPLPDLQSGIDSYAALAGGAHHGKGSSVNARLHNPTVARFEAALAALEGAEAAVAFGSGMAALTALLLARSAHGRHVVAVRPVYGGTDHLLSHGPLGLECTWVEQDGVAAALRPDTSLVIIETPGNPTLDLIDIAAALTMIRIPRPGETVPGVTTQTPYGSVDVGPDGKQNLTMTPEGQQKYKEAKLSLRNKLGPMPSLVKSLPGMPEFPVELGDYNYNPFTGKMERG